MTNNINKQLQIRENSKQLQYTNRIFLKLIKLIGFIQTIDNMLLVIAHHTLNIFEIIVSKKNYEK